MNDGVFVYKTLIKDVYSQGVVLGRKYKLLRTAYNIFMYGLIVSVIAFVAASVIAEK
jgi:pycsar effector protein